MARDWNPCVYPRPRSKKKGPPYTVKFREWERRFEVDPWTRKRGFLTRADAQAHGDQKKHEWRLKAANLWNEQAEQAKVPLQEFIDSFERHVKLGLRLRERRRESAYAKSPQQILCTAAKAMGAKTVADLSRDEATKWLASMRATMRPATLNGYRCMLERFGRWLEDENIVTKSPFRGLPAVPPDERQHRVAFDTDTVLLLAKAGVARVLAKTKGPRVREKSLPRARHRALLVVMTFLTTMRGTALANMAWSWIDDGGVFVRVPAEWVKRPGRPRPQMLPLHSELAKLLCEIRRERGVAAGRPIAGDELVVGERDAKGFARLPGATPRSLRLDAKFAKIEPTDGCALDLMAMRTSCATELRRRGVPRAVVSEIMHTAKSTVADRHYIHEDPAVMTDLRAYLDRVPFKAEQMRGLLFAVQAIAAAVRAPAAAPDSVSSASHQFPSDPLQQAGNAT